MRVAVVGATGAVGSTILGVMRERRFPADEVVPFASERSAGRTIDYGDTDLTVRALSDDAIQDFDLALFSAGGTRSAEWAPRFVDAGAVVVDNSSYWRMHDDVPLVVAEVNPDAIAGHNGIVANPNCSTMQMVVALKPILDAAGIERLVITTMQSVSGTGQRAVEELHDQARAVIEAEEIPAPAVYPHQIAFNVIPQVETFKDGDDYTTEERKMMAETRKILGDDSIRISATCARVPVYTGHSESVNVETRDELSPDDLRSVEIAVPGRMTTAFLALRLFLGSDFRYRELPFDEIIDAVKVGRAAAGLLIHEGQLTYRGHGLQLVVDLGDWWLLETGLPLPLGINVARRDIGGTTLRTLSDVLADSIEAGLANRPEALRYAMRFGRGLDHALTDRFVGMYVNRLTRDYGDEGRQAVEELLTRAERAGAVDRPVRVEFVS